jgi:hypothetical protein
VVLERLRLAVDGAGNAIAVFQEGNAFRARRFDVDTETWEPAVDLQATELTDSGGTVDVGMAPDGTAIASGRRYVQGTYAIWARRFVPNAGSGTWEAATTLDVDPAHFPLKTQTGMDALGNGLVIVFPSNAAPQLHRFLVAGGGWQAGTTTLAGPGGLSGDVAFDPFGMGPGGHAFVAGRNPIASTSLYAVRIP